MSWYAGSIPASQRVVGCLNRSVQIADERMGFVQPQRIGVSSSQLPVADLYAPARAHAIRARRRARNATLAPPPPTVAVGDLPEIFLTFSSQENSPPLFQPVRQSTKRSICKWLLTLR